MSLRAQPKDLCARLHRQDPRPPHPVRAGATGNRTESFGLPARISVAQRQIRQKRRMHHWRHARQLSLCIGNGGLFNQHQYSLTQKLDSKEILELPQAACQQSKLIETLIALVTTRTQFANQGDPIGVLHTSAYIVWTAYRIRRLKLDHLTDVIKL